MHRDKPSARPDLAIETAPTLIDNLPQRLKQLLEQTSARLAHNELRAWGKLLLTPAPAIGTGIARRGERRTVRNTAIAAVVLGVGYYLLKRR